MFLYDCCVACWKIGDLPKEEFLRRERKIESLKPKSAKKGGKVRVTKTAIDCIDKQCPDSAKSVKFDDAIFQPGWAKRLLSVRRWRCEALALKASRRALISIGVVPFKKKRALANKISDFFTKIYFLMINFL